MFRLPMHCVQNMAFRHRPSCPRRRRRRQIQVPFPSSPQLPPQLQPQQITSKASQELQPQPKQERIPQAQPCQVCQQIACQVSYSNYKWLTHVCHLLMLITSAACLNKRNTQSWILCVDSFADMLQHGYGSN